MRPAALSRWEGRPVESLREALGVPRLTVLAETDSSNDTARAQAEEGAAHGTLIVADYQHAGRGRRGRAWLARPGQSLLVSMVLRPQTGEAAGVSPILPLRVGLAAAEACDGFVPGDVRIKWPNDLMIQDAKLGGILCESVSGGPGGPFAIAGIGINVMQQPQDWPPDLDQPATSLLAHADDLPQRLALLQRLVERLLPLRPQEDWRTGEFERIVRRDWLTGRPVEVDGVGRAVARGVDRAGALIVERAGERSAVTGGVRIVREET